MRRFIILMVLLCLLIISLPSCAGQSLRDKLINSTWYHNYGDETGYSYSFHDNGVAELQKMYYGESGWRSENSTTYFWEIVENDTLMFRQSYYKFSAEKSRLEGLNTPIAPKKN